MKIIVRCHPKRQNCIDYLQKYLPREIIFSNDVANDGARANFLNALALAGNESCLHLEDDIYLTQSFLEKVTNVVKKYPNMVIQFYSQNKSDLVTGSRLDTNFLGCLCFYLPANYSAKLLEYFPVWPRKDNQPVGSDLMIRAFLKSINKPYFLSIPSLVQHRSGISLIDPSKPQDRQSPSFVESQGIYE